MDSDVVNLRSDRRQPLSDGIDSFRSAGNHRCVQGAQPVLIGLLKGIQIFLADNDNDLFDIIANVEFLG
jgi:hypothetical protein